MKRVLNIMTVTALILGAISFLPSCEPDKDGIISGEHYLNYNFSVADQMNVKQYEIVVSTTGDVEGQWTSAGVLFAIQEGMIHDYVMSVDVTRWFKSVDVLYSRIKTTDLDGKITYSKVMTTKKG
jgi:hypothetical protein